MRHFAEPIGLIETLRFEGGFVRLERHLERMARSAAYFAVPFDRARAWRVLEESVSGARQALRARLTLDAQGGFNGTVARLGAAPSQWSFALSPLPVESSDPLLRHKTTRRAFFDDEQARLAKSAGCDEAVFCNERGELTEGSRTTIFLRRGAMLLTPPLSCGLLDGVLRRELLVQGSAQEAVLTPDDFARAGEILLGNSLRGLIRAVRVGD